MVESKEQKSAVAFSVNYCIPLNTWLLVNPLVHPNDFMLHFYCSLCVVAELKVVLKLITLGVKFQECAAHSNKSNNSKLTLERNLLIVLTAKR